MANKIKDLKKALSLKKISECSYHITYNLLSIMLKITKGDKFGGEFMVAMCIIGVMRSKVSNKVHVSRGYISNKCQISERQVSRITKTLDDYGVFRKTIINDKELGKSFDFYELNWELVEKAQKIYERISNQYELESDSFDVRSDNESDSFDVRSVRHNDNNDNNEKNDDNDGNEKTDDYEYDGTLPF